MSVNLYFKTTQVVIIGLIILLPAQKAFSKDTVQAEKKVTPNTYTSLSWNKEMNQESAVDEEYPEKRKINPKTVRRTLDEYYIPQFSEFIGKGVDYWEWLQSLDDPYLNKYKVDLKLDSDDDRLKLFWKSKF
ncbi:MAG: hypothetical protein KKB82_02455 [Candidatus Omnitrophica bacterium]|nr:hypothetical protein [Candidatus Omnitrophota bacterium]MBU1924769.1 hypothetical protein [Candidatus Omnitrophota bacterium]MBU2064057.1 hypothetical protein [Candidatus Omnitrophota bacterium]